MAGDEAENRRTDSPGTAPDTAPDTAPGTAPGSNGAEAERGEQEFPGDAEVEARIQEAVDAALAEQRDSVLRAHAEVANMRRRCEMDVEKAHKFALERISADLVNVVDNLERALQAAEGSDHEGVKALHEGVELTLKGFMETLNKYNIEQIDPEGEPFDPQLHEAMAAQPSDQVEPNTVLAVVQKGYSLNGRVIRPARVLVSKS